MFVVLYYACMKKNIDRLIYTAVFSTNAHAKQQARLAIKQTARKLGIIPSSILNLYQAFGKGQVTGFTVPAINIRTLTYDTARIIFRLMIEHSIGAVVFEIARSEIGYTDQRPEEFTVAVLAGAIKEGFKGPVFIQGDHYQFSKNKFADNPAQETQLIKDLIKESIDAGFYNIDIDASTLVDLEKPDLFSQQKLNFEVTAQLTQYIRKLQPKNISISIGGEIGHIGGKNSTVADFEAFMKGYSALIKKDGLSKVSVQTGTSHGGIPLADGTMAKIKLDFSVLRDIGNIARKKYGLGGTVQHGASTLPNELFDKFEEFGALEIHLATGFQNIVYANLPKVLGKEIETWLHDYCSKEWEQGSSEEQFIYKTRKKALGPFKEKLWRLTDKAKQPIQSALKSQFALLFDKLKVKNTKEIVNKYVH